MIQRERTARWGVVVVVLVALTTPQGAAGVSADPGCSATWITIPSVDVAGSVNRLSGVAAVAADDAWAVGNSWDPPREGQSEYGGDEPLIEHWDGGAWTLVDAPEVPGAVGSALRAVAARTSSDVWAVGAFRTVPEDVGVPVEHPLVLRWDGGRWATVPAPGTGPHANGVLTGLHVLAADDVWAVGYYRPDLFAMNAVQPLTLRWDGTTWTVVANDPVIAAQHQTARWSAVTATSPSDVWAAGSSGDAAGVSQSLLQHWDGTSWKVVASPSPRDAAQRSFGTIFSDVTKTGGDLLAVGRAGEEPYAARWDGRRWTRIRMPVTAQAGLHAVTRLPGGSLAAVGGSAGDAGIWETFAVDISRTASGVPSEQVAGSFRSSLDDVSFGGGMQWAVGSSVTTGPDEQSHERTLIQRRCTG